MAVDLNKLREAILQNQNRQSGRSGAPCVRRPMSREIAGHQIPKRGRRSIHRDSSAAWRRPFKRPMNVAAPCKSVSRPPNLDR